MKSLKNNALLNGTKTAFDLIVPLIILPYVSRILQVENLGKINFGTSIINYFILIAQLGVNNYAIREGVQKRKNKDELNRFISEIFSINVVSTLIAYLLFFFVVLSVKKLYNYRELLLLQSISIFFITLSMDWICSVFEEFRYMAIRTMIVKGVILILTFCIVTDEDSYYLYALLTVLSNVLVCICNYYFMKKKCRIKLILHFNYFVHLKPIFYLFSTNIATLIYVSVDTTMLGVIAGDYWVGIYSVSSRIYQAFKSILSSLIITILPRFSYYIKENIVIFWRKFNMVFDAIILLLIYTVAFVNLICDDLIQVLFGYKYLDASKSLRILSIALIFAVLNGLITFGLILPMRQEREQAKATAFGALINVLMNLFFISCWKQNGAAFTTVIAEMSVVVFELFCIRKKLCLNIKELCKDLFSCLVALGLALPLTQFLCIKIDYAIFRIIVEVPVFTFVYSIVLVFMKNTVIINVLKYVNNKMQFKGH